MSWRKSSHRARTEAKVKRGHALALRAYRGPTEPRSFPAGATSAAIKQIDPDLRSKIDAALRDRK